MIELGVAYSYFINKYEKEGEEYIMPFVLYPVTKGQALSGSPMANIQAGEMNDMLHIYAKTDKTFLHFSIAYL